MLVVCLVLRQRLPIASTDVGALVSDYLVSDLSLQQAVELSREGCTDLLQLLWNRSERPGNFNHWSVTNLLQSEPLYRHWAFAQALLQAVKRSDVSMVTWVLEHFPELPVTQDVLVEAAKKGLLWFFEAVEQDISRGGIDWAGEMQTAALKPQFPPPEIRRDVGNGGDETRRSLDLGPRRASVPRGIEACTYIEAYMYKLTPPGYIGAVINSPDDGNALRNVFYLGDVKFRRASRTERRAMRSEEILQSAAEAGRWDVMHWVDSRTGTPEARAKNVGPIYRVFGQNNLTQLQWLVDQGFGMCNLDRPACTDEEWRVRAQMFRYLLNGGHGNPVRYAEMGLQGAAAHGDLETVQWLFRDFIDPSVERLHGIDVEFFHYDVLFDAAQGGHLPVVQWLLTRMERLGIPGGPDRAMFEAAQRGHLAIAEWLSQQYSNVDFLCYIGNDGEEGYSAFDIAALEGHLDVLQLLQRLDLAWRHKRKREDGSLKHCHCTPKAMDAAAERGHLHVVKWLHENRNEGCTKAAMDLAAANGHLEVVKFLHFNRSEGCTTSAMDSAAFMEFHDASRHILTAHCCMNKRPSSFLENQLAILEFLRTNRSEGCTTAAMDGAATVGNLEVVQWLHANTTAGCTTKAMDCAAALGCLDLVKFLHENRSEGCTFRAMDAAAANGHLDVVKWLHRNRSEGCPATALDAAASGCRFGVDRHHNHLRVVQWIVKHCEDLHIISAMGRALMAKNFEAALFLHAQQPSYCKFTRHKISIGIAGGRSRQSSDSEILLAWFKQNYPRST